MNSNQPVVLIIDDEAQIRRFLRAGFELQRFSVLEAETAESGLRAATLSAVDLIIVDLSLPDLDGGAIVERVRSWSTVPIIVLSVRSSEEEKVRLLDLGANDYIVKPFGMAELLARARAALRRQSRDSSGEHVVQAGSLSVDLAARSVSVNGKRLRLSAKEYRLLQALARHAGNVVTHQHLLKEVWGARHINDGHYLRVFMRKLRKKIEKDPTRPRILVTELGIGYRLVQDAEQESLAGR
jgi:two-component system KDP operon response regulator KdpE